jgi:hypothetical protein
MNTVKPRTVTPVYAIGDPVITAFGERGRVVGATPSDHVYVIELEGLGPAINRMHSMRVDMFDHEPKV